MKALLLQYATVALLPISAAAANYVPSREKPPAIAREFRGAWIASVFNINWPSRAGLSSTQQKRELIALLDTAARLNLNAVILQVRPACDALYNSSIEPWSNWLTGTMGRSPGYDPLAFAINEAHARGLELHAWFNPFRALASASTKVHSTHVTKRKPSWIRKYEGKVWLDPGRSDVRAYSLRVIMDVVKRYDIDGAHIDDYFYPYPKNPKSASQFPDLSSYKASSSKLSRNAWRRANIDGFVSSLYNSIKSTKPWVKVGISPFGIWKPGVPRGVKADLNAYEQICGDSRKWLVNGWCDYFSPQLYWPIAGDQSFSALIKWWDGQNPKRRHIWPGLAADRIGAKRSAREHGQQLALTRAKGRRSAGAIHWNLKPLKNNTRGVATLLSKTYYTQKALPPSFPWLSGKSPPTPRLAPRLGRDGFLYLDWSGSGTVRFWAVQIRSKGKWQQPSFSAGARKGMRWKSSDGLPDAVAVTAIDRYGNASSPAVVQKR